MPTHTRGQRLFLTRVGDKVFPIPQTPRGHSQGTYQWVNDRGWPAPVGRILDQAQRAMLSCRKSWQFEDAMSFSPA